MPTKRDDFKKDTWMRAASRVGFLCSKPDCRCHTLGPSAESNQAVSNIGVAAHICAAAPGGKRYDPTMTPEERKGIDNCIWLCQTHAHLIDTDAETYTVEVLKQWKKTAEEYAAKTIADGSFIRNYYAGNQENLSQLEDLFESMIASGEFLLMDQILSQYTASLSEKYDECILRNRIIWCTYCDRPRLALEIETYKNLPDKSGANDLLRLFLSFGMTNELKELNKYCSEQDLTTVVNLAIAGDLDDRLIGKGEPKKYIEVTQVNKDAIDKYLLYIMCAKRMFGLQHEDGLGYTYEPDEMYWSLLWETYGIVSSVTMGTLDPNIALGQITSILKSVANYDASIQALLWDVALYLTMHNKKHFDELYSQCPENVQKDNNIIKVKWLRDIEYERETISVDDLLAYCASIEDYYLTVQFCEKMKDEEECAFLDEHQYLYKKDSRFLHRRIVVHNSLLKTSPMSLLEKYKNDYVEDFLLDCMLADFAPTKEDKEHYFSRLKQYNSGATFFALSHYAKLLSRNSKWEDLIALSNKNLPTVMRHQIADDLVQSKRSECLARGIEIYETLIAAGYTEVNLHNNLGVGYVFQGRVEDAKREFSKEYDAYGSEDVLRRLLSLRIETNDIIDDAYLHSGEKENTCHMQNLVGASYFKLGNYELARKFFLRSLLIDERENPSITGYWNACRKLNRPELTAVGTDTSCIISDESEQIPFAIHHPQILEGLEPSCFAGLKHYSSTDPQIAMLMYCSVGDVVEFNGKQYTVSCVEQVDTPLLKYALSQITKLPSSRIISGTPEEGLSQIIEIMKEQKENQQEVIANYNEMQIRLPLSILAKLLGRSRLVIWEFLAYGNSESIRNNTILVEKPAKKKFILSFDSILTLSRLPLPDKLPEGVLLICPAQVKNQLMADIGEELEQLDESESVGSMQYSDDGGLHMIKHTPDTKRARRTVITKLRALVNKLVVADPVDFVSDDKNIQEFVSAPELRCEKGTLALALNTDDALLITDDQFLSCVANYFQIKNSGIAYLLSEMDLGSEALLASSQRLKELNFQNYLPFVLYKAIFDSVNAEQNAECGEAFGNWLIGDPEEPTVQHKEVVIELYRDMMKSGEDRLNPNNILGQLAITFYESMHPGFVESLWKKALREIGMELTYDEGLADDVTD